MGAAGGERDFGPVRERANPAACQGIVGEVPEGHCCAVTVTWGSSAFGRPITRSKPFVHAVGSCYVCSLRDAE